ncbi:MAG: hypothetical protein LBV71_16125 [Prevotella sp.]|jgi:hypothetical protein|nr:hypothetical protein [Prevotella sp.]
MIDCIVDKDILNGCNYDYAGIDKIYLLPFDEFQALEERPKYSAFNNSFDNSFMIGNGVYYTNILSTTKFIELQADDTSTFRNVFNSHYYNQTLTTKVRRIDQELDNMLSKNKNKKFIVVVFPTINNKIWETFNNVQSLTSTFCFFMGVENGCSWTIQYDVEQKNSSSAYTIQFQTNSYQGLSVIEDIDYKSLITDNVIDYKFIPKEYICVGNTNYEVAMYAVAVTNDRNQQAVDENGELCSISGLKQAAYTYSDVATYEDYIIADLADYDVIGVYELDAIFEGKKVKRYNTTCYNFYNLQLYFTDNQTETSLDELYDFEGENRVYNITCVGKSGKYTATSSTTWLRTSISADNKLTISIDENEDDSRSGTVTLVHNDDSTLKLTINVTQAKNIIIIPEFDYLVFRYFWADTDGRDLDTSTGYINTGITFDDTTQLDNSPVGWSMAGNYNTNVQNYIQFAGDNTGSGNECVFITMNTLVEQYDNIPDVVNIDVYANWFGSRLTGNCKFELTAYKGGAMVQDGYNYDNVGGEEVLITVVNVNIATSGSGKASTYKTDYSKIGQIQYNKLKRNAQYVIDAPIVY